jgi:predicted SAM-dependent methyltransferase
MASLHLMLRAMRHIATISNFKRLPGVSSWLSRSLDARLRIYSIILFTSHYIVKGHLIRSLRIFIFLNQRSKNTNPLGLQVGGGRHLISSPTWINGDLFSGDIFLDARKELPFPDESIKYIFAEQFIEHLTHEQSCLFASECFRILRKDGVLRLATPDLDKLFLVYSGNHPSVTLDTVLKRHFSTHRQFRAVSPPLATDLINDFFYLWGHKNLHNYSSLKRLLLGVGFHHINIVAYGHSQHAHLRNLERHSDPDAPWTRDALNIIIEAKKE